MHRISLRLCLQAQKERSELMRTVAQQEQNIDALSEELALAREEHSEAIRDLTAKAQQELEETLAAAHNEWDRQKQAEWIRLRQEFEREKSQVRDGRHRQPTAIVHPRHAPSPRGLIAL